MGSSLCLYGFVLLCCCFHLVILTNSSSSPQPLCHEDESSHLLQFKHSLFINKSVSSAHSAYPKVESWKLEGTSSDCCSWDGVECDQDTGHVIGLNLSSSFLYGSINSNSSLFNLVHLRSLNLTDNDFNYSQIPHRIGNLSRLTSLDLSNSVFFGQIPSNILYLSKLAYLDLSRNVDLNNHESLLKLEIPNLEDLVQNLTNLKVLDLSSVNISSTVTDGLSNMSSLTILRLEDCQLYGEFPTNIFQLPNLQILSLGNNENLTGYLPEFHRGSPLEELTIEMTSFSKMLPYSIANLESLRSLHLSRCNFSGMLPVSLGNLAQLTYLDLSKNKFLGEMPQSLANLTQLSDFYIGSNELVGQIPSWLMNLTELTFLDLSFNQLHGMIPSSISQLKHLQSLSLAGNNLSGKVKLDIFLQLQNLFHFELSDNKLTVLTKNSTNVTLPKLVAVGLRSCNLKEFPNFLQFQDELQFLYFGDNKIHGEIPTWFWNKSKETMELVDLQHNFLTGFEQHPTVIPWQSLVVLDLGFNRLQGSLPIPPPSTHIYGAAANLLSGEIPPSICHCSSLQALSLSHNNLSGTIPKCLFGFSDSLMALSLSGNNFHGTIPCNNCSSSLQYLDLHDNNLSGTIPFGFSDSLLVLNLSRNNFYGTVPHMMGINLNMIDLSENQLHGLEPRSLENATKLEILVLGNNQMGGTFPSWLGALPRLQVLILRSNRFHGAINASKANLNFPKLRIIDLSNNGFSGNLPSEYFQKWNAMTMVKRKKLSYMQSSQQDLEIKLTNSTTFQKVTVRIEPYMYSIIMDTKGTKRFYEKIQQALIVVDLSNNKFGGGIPESLGRLNGLQMLNLSNNNLTGVIPSSLANLMELESLDLSRNLLFGEIPQQLTQLTFLEFLNVSHNHLTGPIPQGQQFDTFENNSYDGNFGLCGNPLSKLCGNSEPSPPPPPLSFQGDDSKFPSGVDWIVISMGYGSGLIVGLVIGHTLTARYHEWFVETFGRKKQTERRVKRKARRN